jgi:polyphosphate kinase
MALVVRREGPLIRRYVHLGTGNYNQVTARLYTDVGLLTARPEIGEDSARIFNLLTGMSQFPGLQKLRMAPFGLHTEFERLIEREIEHAKKHKNDKPGTGVRIIAKMNSLVDPDIIKTLYRASQAGVQIDLIIRGICCLRPGVPGISDNIRVRSIIDRFLEHPRIYYFANGGQEEIYCGSADWMPRNFFRRIEVVFPVEDEKLKTRLRDEILMASLHDNVKARLIQPDGTHVRVKREPHEKALRSQMWLLERAAQGEASLPDFLAGRPAAAPQTAGEQVSAAVSLPGIYEMTPRSAPQTIAPLFTDGRAGTLHDPVLQSAAAEWEASPEAQELQREDLERRVTTVVSDEVEPAANKAALPTDEGAPRAVTDAAAVDAQATAPLKSTHERKGGPENTSTRKASPRKRRSTS